MRFAVASLAILGALVLAGCTSHSTPVDDKYEQTWTTPYSETTCSAYLNEMTTQQRWAAAADMLAGARNKMDGGSGLPSDDLVTRFAADIAEGCSGGPVAKLTEAAITIYQLDRIYAPTP